MGKKKVPTRKTSRGFRGRSHSKQVKPLVVLAVEGATEKQYLNALNQHLYGRAFSFIFCRNVSKSSLKNLVEKIKGGFFGGDIISIYFNRITAALNVEDLHLLMPVMRDAGNGADGIIKGTRKFHIAVFSRFFQSLWRLFHKIRFSFCKYK